MPVATKDGCICNDGYTPKPSTSSQDGTLECTACPAGTYARAGDLSCTNCSENFVSVAASSDCFECRTSRKTSTYNGILVYSVQSQANAAQTACECVVLQQNSAYNVVCSTQPTIGLQASCSCSYQYPNQGEFCSSSAAVLLALGVSVQSKRVCVSQCQHLRRCAYAYMCGGCVREAAVHLGMHCTIVSCLRAVRQFWQARSHPVCNCLHTCAAILPSTARYACAALD